VTDPTIDRPDRRLTPSEDGVLRRLFAFVKSGSALAPAIDELKDELRSRDQRVDVREPEITIVRVPPYV